MKSSPFLLRFSATLALLALVFFGMNGFVRAAEEAETQPTSVPTFLPTDDTDVGGDSRFCAGLAEKIRTGDIHLDTLPCFVKFFSETVIAFAGTVSVLFVIIGGFKYVVAGITEDKESAKKTILYALIGLAVTLLSWVIVDVVLQIATE